MAPEISTGNYNKQIDIYAAGVILYEMLTGRVPFDGESAGEILMKHLTSPPDLSKVPAEYLPIVAKALAKNPAQRYASMAEMARAVEASARRAGAGRPAAAGAAEGRRRCRRRGPGRSRATRNPDRDPGADDARAGRRAGRLDGAGRRLRPAGDDAVGVDRPDAEPDRGRHASSS